MKKKYEKPQFFIENFEVAEFVAGVCDLDYVGEDGTKNSTTPEQCNAYWDPYFPVDKIFLTTTANTCDVKTNEDLTEGPFKDLCYNNPGNISKTFLS